MVRFVRTLSSEKFFTLLKRSFASQTTSAKQHAWGTCILFLPLSPTIQISYPHKWMKPSLRCTQSFGVVTWGLETTWKTKAQMGKYHVNGSLVSMIGVRSGLIWPRIGVSDGALVNAVMNLLFPYKAGNCLTRWITFSLPRILLHVVRQLVSYVLLSKTLLLLFRQTDLKDLDLVYYWSEIHSVSAKLRM